MSCWQSNTSTQVRPGHCCFSEPLSDTALAFYKKLLRTRMDRVYTSLNTSCPSPPHSTFIHVMLFLFFTSFLSSSPSLSAVTPIGADYWPDHNTDRCPAACDPSLPLLIPVRPSCSTLAFLGRKQQHRENSDWIFICPTCEITVWRQCHMKRVRRGEHSLLLTLTW